MNNKSFCGNCGAELKPGDVFCAECGCPVKSDDAQTGNFNGNQTVANKPNVFKGTMSKMTSSDKWILIAFGAFVVIVAIIGIIVAVYAGTKANDSGESDVSNNSIVGTWLTQDGEGIAYEFYEDGSCTGGDAEFYEAGENGIIRFVGIYRDIYGTYYYKVDGNKLYIAKDKEELQERIENGRYYIRK